MGNGGVNVLSLNEMEAEAKRNVKQKVRLLTKNILHLPHYKNKLYT